MWTIKDNNIKKQINKNELKYAYFDLDGTLLDFNDQISQENVDALNNMQNNGWSIGFATGRGDGKILALYDLIKPRLPIICEGGVVILNPNDPKKILYDSLLELDIISVINTFNKYRLSYFLFATDSVFCTPDLLDDPRISYFKKLVFTADFINKEIKTIPITNVSNINDVSCRKIFIVTKENEKQLEIKQVFNCFNNIMLNRITSDLYELSPMGTNKAGAIKKLAGNYLDLDKLIVFGDNENDLCMFEIAKYSVAMKNGSYNAIRAADFVTEFDNNNSGCGRFINKYLL